MKKNEDNKKNNGIRQVVIPGANEGNPPSEPRSYAANGEQRVPQENARGTMNQERPAQRVPRESNVEYPPNPQRNNRPPNRPASSQNGKRKKRSKKNKLIDRALLVAAILLFCIAGYFLISPMIRDYQRGEKVSDILSSIKQAEPVSAEDTVVTFIVSKDALVVPGEELEAANGETYDLDSVLGEMPDNVTLTALGTIRIPSVEMDIPLLDDAGVIPLRYGAGMLKGTAMPGQDGNMVVLGHNMRKDGSLFNRLKKVVIGDEIIITMVDKTEYVYVVDDIKQPIAPSNLPEYIDIDDGYGKQITLLTCTLDGGTHRLLVIGHLSEVRNQPSK